MFDNVAFNVVIGLIFVYLLYSLLVTILSEMIAARLGFRQRILRVCIERMLNDGYYDQSLNWMQKFSNWLASLFLYERKDFKYTVAGRFYASPSVKYLAKNKKTHAMSFRQSKPSYLTPETFAITMIRLLRDKGLGATDMEKIDYALQFNTLHFQQETLTYFRGMVKDAGGDVNVFGESLKKWFVEANDRASGWYKRFLTRISLALGLIIAMVFNVDSIRITKTLSKDKDARNQLVNLGIGVTKDTGRYSFFVKTAGDSVPSKTIVDSGLAHVSRDLSQANILIGAGWGLEKLHNPHSLLVDSNQQPKIYRQLMDYKNQADQHLHLSDEMTQKIREMAKVRLDLADKDIQGRRKFSKKDSLLFQQQRDSIKKAFESLGIQVARDSLERSMLRPYREFTDPINGLLKEEFSNVDSIVPKGKAVQIVGAIPYSAKEKLQYVLKGIFGDAGRLLGFFITALALSLGAPFWFDLLSKFVAIRGTGVRPDDKKDTSDSPVKTADQPLINVPDKKKLSSPEPSSLQAAVESARVKLANEMGVLSVDEGLAGTKDKLTDAIEVHVKNGSAKDAVQKILGSKYKDLPVSIIVTSIATVHALPPGSKITNQPLVNGMGSLGCYLKKDGSNDTFLISCWHVLKGDQNWFANSGPTTVSDGNDQAIGRLVDGCLSTNMDVGFAVLTNGQVFNDVRKNWREVIKSDVRATQVRFRGAGSGPKEATVFNHSVNMKEGIEYPDGRMRILTDVFSISELDNRGKPISAPSKKGDSGALVLDSDNVPLGIIVGGDNKFTYVVKLSNILAEDSIYNEYKILTDQI